MSKISSKLRTLQLTTPQQQDAGAAAGEGAAAAPVKAAAAAPARKIETLHDAAKWGDVEAATKMIEAGADVNGKVRGKAG
jgi:hypothetical protein